MKCLINIVYHSLLVKNKKGEGKGGLKERWEGGGGLLTFFPLMGRGAYLREGA